MSAELPTQWRIERYISPDIAISGIGYWTADPGIAPLLSREEAMEWYSACLRHGAAPDGVRVVRIERFVEVAA